LCSDASAGKKGPNPGGERGEKKSDTFSREKKGLGFAIEKKNTMNIVPVNSLVKERGTAHDDA